MTAFVLQGHIYLTVKVCLHFKVLFLHKGFVDEPQVKLLT